MTRIGLCIASLLLPVAATATETQVVVVADSSVASWRTLEDGSSAAVALRIALDNLLASTSTADGLRMGLRFIGSEIPFTDGDACRDVTLALPIGEPDRNRVVASLERASPIGSRPLIGGLIAAADDFDDSSAVRRIVLVTTGDDNCFADRRKAGAALTGGIDLRIVGLGLEGAVLERLSAVAPTRNARTTVELEVALRWAILDRKESAKAEAKAELSIVPAAGIPEGTVVRIHHSIAENTINLKRSGDVLRASARPGSYTVSATDADDTVTEAGPLVVAAGAENSFRLALEPTPPVTLEVIPAKPVAGDEVFVQYWGAPDGQHWLTVAPAAAPLHAWTARAAATGGSGWVLLRLPVHPQGLELRFIERQPDSLARIIGRLGLKSLQPRRSFKLPENTVVGTQLEVVWQGDAQPGDHLSIAPEGANPSLHTACIFASAGNPITLPAPGRTGNFVVRYISGVSGTVLAEGSTEVLPLPIELDAPEQVAARREFTVSWSGPPGEGDYLVLAEREAAEDSYLILQPASESGQAVFESPALEGHYEIRYADGATDRIRARATIEVVAMAATITAPASVRAGTRVKIFWTGPDAPGDVITIASPGSNWAARLDWTHTSLGSPANLAAPFDPGVYELRYVSTRDRKILSRATLIVE
jgi:Ca-activated chloride channel family protein